MDHSGELDEQFPGNLLVMNMHGAVMSHFACA